MSNVTLLPPKGPTPPREPNPATIEILRDLLVRAMSGDIDSIGVAFVEKGSIMTTFEYNDNVDYPALIGAVSVLNTRITLGE